MSDDEVEGDEDDICNPNCKQPSTTYSQGLIRAKKLFDQTY